LQMDEVLLLRRVLQPRRDLERVADLDLEFGVSPHPRP
jgi:hypothetical protein